MRLILYIIILFPLLFIGQNNTPLKIQEDSLIYLLNEERIKSIYKETVNLNNPFESYLNKVLENDAAFRYPFDSLSKFMSIIKSPDDQIRIFNWNYELVNEQQLYGCFIMRFDKHTNSYSSTKLNDASMFAKDPEYTQYNKKNWYGALYYAIIPVKKDKSVYYTLLGWDGNNKFSNKKIIETMSFQSNGNIKFGLPYFIYPNGKTKRRVVFQYNKQSYMSLKYFKERKEELIIFDHLIPKSPQLEGMYDWYVTDLSFDAFKLENEKWVFIGQVNKNSKKDSKNRPYNNP
jgi:hypothetical protein